jgi:hypothetical protein
MRLPLYLCSQEMQDSADKAAGHGPGVPVPENESGGQVGVRMTSLSKGFVHPNTLTSTISSCT